MIRRSASGEQCLRHPQDGWSANAAWKRASSVSRPARAGEISHTGHFRFSFGSKGLRMRWPAVLGQSLTRVCMKWGLTARLSVPATPTAPPNDARHRVYIRRVVRPVGVPYNQISPLGDSGNSPEANAMIARPSSTIGAVTTSFAPRVDMRSFSRSLQLRISSAGIESRAASRTHASSERAKMIFRCSVDRFSPNERPMSGMHATIRHDDT